MDRFEPLEPTLASLLAALDQPQLARAPGLAAWARATDAVLGATITEPNHPDALRDRLQALADAWAWARLVAELDTTPDPGDSWPQRVHDAGLAPGLSRDALARLREAHPATTAFALAAARRERLCDTLLRLEPAALAAALVRDTHCAVAALDALRDPTPGPLALRLARTLPWLAGLAHTHDSDAAVEHDPRVAHATSPVLLHLLRVLDKKLAGLEHGDPERFQDDRALSTAALLSERQRLARLDQAGLLPCLRAALLHLDFAKAGSPEQRRRWQHALGVDLTVHNEAAVRLLERDTAPGASRPGLLHAFEPVAEPPLQTLVRALVGAHGLTGQALRGEATLVAFAPLLGALRHELDALCDHLGAAREHTVELALDALHLVNVCDTAGVREGLLDDTLRAGMLELLGHLRRLAASPDAPPCDPPEARDAALEAELAAYEDAHWRAIADAAPVLALGGPAGTDEGPLSSSAARLVDRLARLRRGRILEGEPAALCEAAIRAEAPEAIERLGALLRTCQLWYAEAATSALSPSAQLKVLAIAIAAADRLETVDTRRAFHVSLQPLLGSLHRGAGGPSVPYRVRLVEALVEPIALATILDPAASSVLADSPLGTFATSIGGTTAVALGFEESAEAAALLTLLPIYETKSSAAFHATLKTLCDLYGLRKDEFDRVANETLYLVHMNSARSDKARMLDHVRPGRIVEVGPGGGIVLDLLEERFPDSEVIGLDVSHMVVEALRARKQRDGRRWSIVEADAFEMPARMGEASLDTVIFCSLLHEIYSYVEHVDPDSGARSRFRLESVRDLLRASYRALRPGGRIVIRDGVTPEPSVRILELLADDARPFLELFVAQFEGRRIAFEEVDGSQGRRVRMSAADAMEFLYCYTWGAESFPYEVREQYGVLPYLEYRDAVLGWLAGDERHPPRWIALPPAERSYLQPGYQTGLAGKVALYDADGAPVALPDSNCLLVFEKGSA